MATYIAVNRKEARKHLPPDVLKEMKKMKCDKCGKKVVASADNYEQYVSQFGQDLEVLCRECGDQVLESEDVIVHVGPPDPAVERRCKQWQTEKN